MQGLFVGADYVHQHWTDLDRTRRSERAGAVRSHGDRPDAHAWPRPTPRGRSCRSTAACAQVNVLMNLGVADYDGLQTQVSYRGNAKLYAALSYTLSKATNTTEPDGNGIGPNDANIARLGEEERGPSVRRSASSRGDHVQLPAAVQHHRRHGDAAGVGAAVQRRHRHRQQRRRRQQRPPGGRRRGDRQVARSAAPAPRTCRLFVERPHQARRPRRVLLRLEGFNLFNHGNILGRAQTTYGDTATVNPTFGQVVGGRHGDQRASGAGQHRSAADVPVPGEVSVLTGRLGLLSREAVVVGLAHRRARCAFASLAPSPTNFSFAGSQCKMRPVRSAITIRCPTIADWWPASTGLIGSLRVRTASKKFAM